VPLSNKQTNKQDKFCYLADLISAGRKAEEASRALVLTSRGASFKVKGKVYRVMPIA